jgi:carbamoyl-phosphate synthase large subunit
MDASKTAPTFHLADHAWVVPRCTSPDFLGVVGRLSVQNDIKLIIPTIDTELPVYAAERDWFAQKNIELCISHPDTVQICADKALTNSWLRAHNFPTVRQWSLAEASAQADGLPFPLIAKPRRGSASVGIRRISCLADLRSTLCESESYVFEEIAKGSEFTVNVFVNRAGKCVCAVPHERLEVRAGEVSKARTVKHPRLMNLCRDVAEALPGAFGPLNVQLFVDSPDVIRIIEINARFGGGYPVAHEAGAHFTRWLIENASERSSPKCFDNWRDNLVMLRYDTAIYLSGSAIA